MGLDFYAEQWWYDRTIKKRRALGWTAEFVVVGGRGEGYWGVVCTQILPFADVKVSELWGAVEAEIYKALSEA